MCGRFTQKLTWREVHDLYQLLADAPPDNMRPRWNGAPTQDFAACRLDPEGHRYGSCPINARAETVDAMPAFRSAFKSRRCLALADAGLLSTRRRGKTRSRWRLCL